MAENNWLINDSAPTGLAQEFATPQAEASWGWFGLPMGGEGMLFDTPATPWAYDFSVTPFYMWVAQGGGATLYFQTLSAVEVSMVSISKNIFFKRAIAVISVSLPTISLYVTHIGGVLYYKTLSAVEVSVATISRQALFKKAIIVVSLSVATITKVFIPFVAGGRKIIRMMMGMGK